MNNRSLKLSLGFSRAAPGQQHGHILLVLDVGFAELPDKIAFFQDGSENNPGGP